MMDIKEVYKLAHREAINRWFEENEKYQETESKLYEERADNAWKVLKDLEAWGHENGLEWA